MGDGGRWSGAAGLLLGIAVVAAGGAVAATALGGSWGGIAPSLRWLGGSVAAVALPLAVVWRVLRARIVSHRPEAASELCVLWGGIRRALLVLAVAAAMGEVAIRVFDQGPAPQWWLENGMALGEGRAMQFDPELGWVGVPHHRRVGRQAGRELDFAFNAQGFRDIEQDLDLDGPPRLLIVGDSFGQGWGVTADEAVSAQLRPLLPGYVVINQATPSYRLDQVVRAYRRGGRPLRPDVVVAVVISSVGMRESRPVRGLAAPWCRLREGQLEWHGIPVPQLPVDPAALAAYDAAQQRLEVTSIADAAFFLWDAWLPRHSALARRCERALSYRYPALDRRHPADPVAVALVEQLARDVTQDGGRVVFAAAPPHWVVHDAGAERRMRDWTQGFAATGAEVLDLYDVLLPASGALYTEGSGAHPDARGHAAVAKAIAARLDGGSR